MNFYLFFTALPSMYSLPLSLFPFPSLIPLIDFNLMPTMASRFMTKLMVNTAFASY